MTQQTLTVQLPDTLYRQLDRRARRMHRSVEGEMVAVLAATLPTLDDLPADIADEMVQLTFLGDDELWRAAQTTLTADETWRMQELLLKRQREGLSKQERSETRLLLHLYDRIMLVRAQAMALLKERGHDVSRLVQPPSSP